MAYKTRFRFRFQSNVNDNVFHIDISQNGYTGATLDRCVGGSPILRRDTNEHIGGTSLEFPAECQVNEEFACLYTSNPLEFKAELFCNGRSVWQGYVTPELYAEPDIAPPYDVTVTCTDGLGELKNVPFTGNNTSTLQATISGILVNTGLSLSIQKVSSISAVRAQLDFLSTAIYDSRHLTGKTCYEVLQTILRSLNMHITQVSGYWLLYREGDISASSLPTVQMGSMVSAPWWVVGQLSNEVQPARKSVNVSCAAHYSENVLPSISTWTPNSATWSTDHWVLPLAAMLSHEESITGASFRQLLAIQGRSVGSNAAKIKIMVRMTSTTGSYYYLKETTETESYTDRRSGHRVTHAAGFSWESGATYIEKTFDASSESSTDLQSIELSLPFSAGARDMNYRPSSLFVLIQTDGTSGSSAAIYDVLLSKESQLTGFRDILNIDNGARGDADEVDVDFIPLVTDTTSGGIYSEVGYRTAEALQFMYGSLRDSSGNILINFRTSQLGSQPYLSLISRDYALGVALPRLVKSGMVNVPYNSTPFIPVRATASSLEFVFNTWSWDLVNDELSFEMVSLPAASITVASEETQVSAPVTNTASSTVHSSGGSGGGTGGSITAADVVNALGYTPVNPSDIHTADWNAAADKAHEHSNKSVLDGVTQSVIDDWNDAVADSHTHANKGILDTITQTLINAWNATVNKAHEHGNKSLLDNIAQDDVDSWDEAATDSHTHANKATLDGITSAKVGHWESAYSYMHLHNNKTLLDSLTAGDIHTHSNKTLLDSLTAGDFHTHSNKEVLDAIDSDDISNWNGIADKALTKEAADHLYQPIGGGTESDVFICKYNETLYTAVDAVYGTKTVLCDYNSRTLTLSKIDDDDNFIFRGFSNDDIIETKLMATGWSSATVVPMGGSEFYVANYNGVTEQDLDSEYKAGKKLICKKDNGLFLLTKVGTNGYGYHFCGVRDGKVIDILCDQGGWSYTQKEIPDIYFAEYGEDSFQDMETEYNAGKKIFLHDGNTNIYPLTDYTAVNGVYMFIFYGYRADGAIVRMSLDTTDAWDWQVMETKSVTIWYGTDAYNEIIDFVKKGYDVTVLRSYSLDGDVSVYHLLECAPSEQQMYFHRINKEGRVEFCTVDINEDWDVYYP